MSGRRVPEVDIVRGQLVHMARFILQFDYRLCNTLDHCMTLCYNVHTLHTTDTVLYCPTLHTTDTVSYCPTLELHENSPRHRVMYRR